MKISILTPSYNQAKYIEKNILSVLKQNWHDIEHVIIDGGSTDSTVSIIKKYEQHITKWISEPDKGIADGMNMGSQLGVQLTGVIATLVFTAVVTYVILKLVDATLGLRVTDEDETQGLDITQHEERGYIL